MIKVHGQSVGQSFTSKLIWFKGEQLPRVGWVLTLHLAEKPYIVSPPKSWKIDNKNMLNFLLYSSASLIWGSTWLAIKLQLTQVPPILSVAYRFCLAAFLLLTYCHLTQKRLNFSLHDHCFMMLQGVTLFGLGYCCSYLVIFYVLPDFFDYFHFIFTTSIWNLLPLVRHNYYINMT